MEVIPMQDFMVTHTSVIQSHYEVLQTRRREGHRASDVAPSMDGFGSDTDEFESGYHLLPHFNSNTNTNPNLLEYEYKTDGSNSNSHSDVYSESTRNYFPKI